jgi:predicted PurR-regulated permease PerM
VLTFFGGFVPIIGAFVAGAFAVLVALVSNGVTTALIVLIIVIAVQQIEGNILQPIIQGRGFNLHAAVVILAVTAGSALAGIIGAFLSVPIAALIAVVYRYVRDELDGRSPEVAPDGTEARIEGDDAGAELTREQVTTPGDPSVGGASVGRTDESPRNESSSS